MKPLRTPFLDRLAASDRRYTVTMLHAPPLTLKPQLSAWGLARLADRRKRRTILLLALDVLQRVAEADPDGARKLNRVGFSASDSQQGHILAALTVDQLLDDKILAGRVLTLAGRYSGQAASLTQMSFAL